MDRRPIWAWRHRVEIDASRIFETDGTLPRSCFSSFLQRFDGARLQYFFTICSFWHFYEFEFDTSLHMASWLSFWTLYSMCTRPACAAPAAADFFCCCAALWIFLCAVRCFLRAERLALQSTGWSAADCGG
eukprot:s1539_g5.t1